MFYGNKWALVWFVSLFFPLVLSLFPSFFFPVLPLFLLPFLLCCLVLQKRFFFFFHEPEDIPKTRANNLPFCTMSLLLLGSILCPMPAPSGYYTVLYDYSFWVLYCTPCLLLLGAILYPMPAPSEWLSSQLISNLLYSTLWPPEGAFIQEKHAPKELKLTFCGILWGLFCIFFSFPTSI